MNFKPSIIRAHSYLLLIFFIFSFFVINTNISSADEIDAGNGGGSFSYCSGDVEYSYDDTRPAGQKLKEVKDCDCGCDADKEHCISSSSCPSTPPPCDGSCSPSCGYQQYCEASSCTCQDVSEPTPPSCGVNPKECQNGSIQGV